jgi:hypothetical protein
MTASAGEITEAEIPQVAEFLARQVPVGEATTANPLPPVDRLRWLLLENPARSAEVPFGWRIMSEGGAVVGAAICTPMRIHSRNVELTALMFSKFYVDVSYRGMGLGLLMRFIRLGRRYPLFCTSTNAVAGAMFEKLGALPINGLDHTMLGIACPGPLLEEWIYRRSHLKSAARIVSIGTGFLPGRIRRLTRGSSAAALVPVSRVDELSALATSPANDVTAVIRDRDYLHWRYFAGQRDKDVYRFTYPDEPDRLIVVNQTRAGHRGQIRVLNVLDVWPPTSADSAPALCAALSLRYAKQFDTIWLRSQPPAAEDSLRACGFIRRTFPAQLGWYIDSQNRFPTKNWYVMPGESE